METYRNIFEGDTPLIVLETFTHETIWGGKKLAPYAGIKSDKIGHLYSLCCENGLETRIANGAYKGQGFQRYFEDNKEKFGLGKYQEFPLILALVEANDNLSIQVHPDDRVALEEEHAEYGKNESWYFLEAPTSGVIYNGCLALDNGQVRKKMEEDDLMSVVDTLVVSTGDYVYVEAGTLHALSAGSYLYEIEENSPWTYRMYDYNRTDSNGNKRELHIDKAMKALKLKSKSKVVNLGNAPKEERRYVIQKYENISDYINTSTTLECLTVIKGTCVADGVQASVGTTIVLEPGEKINGNFRLLMMARPK